MHVPACPCQVLPLWNPLSRAPTFASVWLWHIQSQDVSMPSDIAHLPPPALSCAIPASLPCITHILYHLVMFHNSMLLQHVSKSSGQAWMECSGFHWQSIKHCHKYSTNILHHSQLNTCVPGHQPLERVQCQFSANLICNCSTSSMVGSLGILVTSWAAILCFILAMTVLCIILSCFDSFLLLSRTWNSLMSARQCDL